MRVATAVVIQHAVQPCHVQKSAFVALLPIFPLPLLKISLSLLDTKLGRRQGENTTGSWGEGGGNQHILYKMYTRVKEFLNHILNAKYG